MINADWKARFAQINTGYHARILERVVDRYEPPKTLTALQNSLNQAKTDQAIVDVQTLSESMTSELAMAMGLLRSEETPYANQHPIYYRLCVRYAGRIYRGRRAYFHTVLAYQSHRFVKDFSIAIQYRDILALDLCFTELSKSLAPPAENASVDELADSIGKVVADRQQKLQQGLDRIRQSESLDPNQVERNRKRLDRLESYGRSALEVLHCERTIGDRKRNPGVRNRRCPKKNTSGFDSARVPSLFPANDDRPPVEMAIYGEERLPAHESLTNEQLTYCTPPAGEERNDPPGPRLRIRHAAPYSNRVAQQSQERTDLTRLQNDTLVSAADYHRLSPGTLAKALFWLYHAGDQAFVFGWLAATTGLPLRRLRKTLMKAGLPVGEAPHYDVEQGIFQYRILDGATPVEDGQNRVVALHLPTPLPRLLGQIADAYDPNERDEGDLSLPLAAGRVTASNQLRLRFSDSPGPPVTLRALRAGALEWLIPAARDEIEALLITGQLGNYHGAADAYRSSKVSEINNIYRSACYRLAEHVQTREPCLRHVYEMLRATPPEPSLDYRIGSQRAVGASDWRELFRCIRDRATAAEIDVGTSPPLSHEKLVNLIQFYQHVSAYAFLGWSLASAARPISPRSTILLKGDEAFVIDKSTRAHLERREVPIVASVKQQIESAWRLLNQVIALAREQDPVQIHLEYQSDRIQLAPWVYWSRSEIKVQDVRMEHVRRWSMCFDCNLRRWPINVARHSAVAMLRDRVSTVALDALLGHARGSRDVASTWSGLPLSQVFAELRPAMNAMLTDVGYQPLRVGSYE